MRRIKHARGLFALGLVSWACAVGKPIDDLAPATGPWGTQATVRYGDSRPQLQVVGELIAVREDGLLLLRDDRLVLVDYHVTRSATFSDTEGVGSFRGAGSEHQRRTLASFSRYPFGLTAVQLSRLLESLGQDELDVVR